MTTTLVQGGTVVAFHEGEHRLLRGGQVLCEDGQIAFVGQEYAGPADQTIDAGQHVGLANVDERLRAAFGDGFGLVVETALGAGTKVSMRVPKFRPEVRA